MFMYDAYLLLGLGIAYLIFYLLKLKYLDIEKLMLSIALSGLVIIGMTLVKYFVKGFAQEIIYDRFGLLVNVNPNFLGLYLNMALPCAFFMALSEKCVNSKKVLLYAVSIVYICVMVMTGSRGCLPGAILVIGYFVWRKRSLKVFLSNLIASGTILIVFGSNLIERMVTPSVDGVAELGRIFLLKAAFKILEANHYVFGIGMNSFALAKFDYGCPRWLPAPVPTETMSSHNVFMEVWVGWGILGLFGWLIFNGAVLHAIFLNRKKSVYKNNVYAYAVAFAMISFLIYGLVDSNIGNFSMMFTYFTLVGIAFFIESENTAKLSVNGG
ncbi:MAG: O-antigen ligase family protein [Chitinispirillales bacterium]|jgi:O-antigen ligase|nr:O-antigen ligase family protein [Chitinispirillales bacterium]